MTKELGDECAGWLVPELGWRSQLLNATTIEHHDAIGQSEGFCLIMRDMNGCEPEFSGQSS